MEQLFQFSSRISDPASIAAGKVFRGEERKNYREIRRHEGVDGIPDTFGVVKIR